MISVLILEDELKAARELSELIARLRSDMQVMAMHGSVKQAIGWLEKNPLPDLVLSDIELSDGLSFDVFAAVDVRAPVIFCTAFDQYALSAFEANGIDYLLKPIERDKLEKSLERFDRLRAHFRIEDASQRMTGLAAQLYRAPVSNLLVHFQGRIIPVSTRDIGFVYSKEEKVRVFARGEAYDFHENMDEVMSRLEPAAFYRANRQFIVHRSYIVSIERLFGRKLLVRLSVPTPETVLVSKAKSAEFLEWLER